MSLVDDKDYSESEKNVLFDQNFQDSDKYSLSPEQYEAIMQMEKEKETKEREDRIAKENLQKLEAQIDNQSR